MNPEERNLLIETARLTKENNEILRKMRKGLAWGRALRIFYWLLIIGLSFGAYYFIQPYVDQLSQAYSGFQTDVGTVKNVSGNVSGLLKNLGI